MRKRFKCLYCDREYSSESGRRVHVNAKHTANPKVYPCPHPGCGHVLGSSSALWRHKKYFCAYIGADNESGNGHEEQDTHPEQGAFGDITPNVTIDQPSTIAGALLPTGQSHGASNATPSSLPTPSTSAYWSQSTTPSDSEGLSSTSSPYSYWGRSDDVSPQSAISFPSSSSSSSFAPYFVSDYEGPAAASNLTERVDQEYSHALSSEAIEAWHSNLPGAFDLGPPVPAGAYQVGHQATSGQVHAHTFNDAIAPYEEAPDLHASDATASINSGAVWGSSLLVPHQSTTLTTDPANTPSFFDSNMPTYPATDDIFGFDYFVSDTDLDRYFALWRGSGPSTGDTSALGSTSEAGVGRSVGSEGRKVDDRQD